MNSQSCLIRRLVSLFLPLAVIVLATPSLAADQVYSPTIGAAGATVNATVGTNKFYGLIGQSMIGESQTTSGKLQIGGVYTWLGEKGITITAPGAGAVWSRQAKNTVTWIPKNMPPQAKILIKYDYDGSMQFQTTIVGNVSAADGQYEIPENFLSASGPNQARISIHCDDPVDVVSEPFTVSDVPPGTVPLTISRDGANIKISWDPSFSTTGNPQIFVLSGTGNGDFTNTPSNWQSIAGSPAFNETHYADHYVLHSGQVGNIGDFQEAYYKAVQYGVDAGAIEPTSGKSYLEIAWAVGKVNVALTGSVNLVSTPFELADKTIQGVFGDQMGINNARLAGFDNDIKTYSEYTYLGSWILTLGNAFEITPGRAYWLNDAKLGVITLVGSVPSTPYSESLPSNSTHNSPNLFSLPTPRLRSTVEEAGLLPSHNVSDQLARYINEFKSYEFMEANGTAWVVTTPPASVFGLNPGFGYWEVNTGNNPAQFNLSRP